MFENVLGHEDVKKLLEHQIDSGTVSHAYMFSGPEGIGKRKLAIEFAKELLNASNLDTCVDYKYIEKLPEKTEISVEQIRNQIIDGIYIAPATCNHKVYVINDAHLMNSSGQNALLKTLEEPPAYVVIILITHYESSLLTTILSRVNKIAFNKLDNSNIKKVILSLNCPYLDESMLNYANGSVKKALEQAREDGLYSKVEKLYGLLKRKKVLEAMQLFGEISLKDEEVLNYMEYLAIQDNAYFKVTVIERERE